MLDTPESTEQKEGKPINSESHPFELPTSYPWKMNAETTQQPILISCFSLPRKKKKNPDSSCMAYIWPTWQELIFFFFC